MTEASFGIIVGSSDQGEELACGLAHGRLHSIIYNMKDPHSITINGAWSCLQRLSEGLLRDSWHGLWVSAISRLGVW